MRQPFVALCLIFLAAPAVAAFPADTGTKGRLAHQAHRLGRGARPDNLSAEISANGIGWKQFVTTSNVDTPGSDPLGSYLAPELASWALMVSGIGLAGSLLRCSPPKKV